MNRRNFLQLSSTSLAAIMLGKLSFAQDGKHIMNAPDEVWAQSGGEWHQLAASNQTAYTYKDIKVILKRELDIIAVRVQSSTQPLETIKLVWKQPVPAGAKVLPDHWERTYGDIYWQTPTANKRMPWYFIQHDGGTANCFGVKTGANTICSWALGDDKLSLSLDTRSGGAGVQLGDRILHAADIITTKNRLGEPLFATAQRFCKLMCANPVLPKQPVYGINDWYFAYGNNSYDLILQHTSMLAELVSNTDNRPFSVIDAGWAKYSPYLPGDGGWADDFSVPNDKFKDMHKMAGAIQKLDMRPGLWTRALCAKYNDPKNLLLPSIPGRDDPKQPVLDPTIEENLNRVKNNFTIYRQWGYEMVKHDFSTYDILGKWGFDMASDITTTGWRFSDNTKTTAEIVLNLYKTIRAAAGDMYLIGCNTFGHLGAGFFELSRIGDDTSGKEWARTKKMGVNTMAFRLPQHNHFYAVDGDCVGVTKDVPWAKNKQWMQLLAESGAPLFISAQPDAMGAEQKQFIKQSFAQAAKVQPVGEPLDWLTDQWPAKWKLNGREVDFDWG